jgi:large subunit ribosomal protein L25
MSVTVTAVKRTLSTRGALQSHRRAGLVPAVLYGKGIDSQLLFVAEKDVRKLLESPTLVDLSIDGRPVRAMVRDIQKHPIQKKVLHVDFMKVEMNRPIEAEVPLVLVGESSGVKKGGVLEQALRTVEIRCLPVDLPDHLELNVSRLDIGDFITLEDLKLPEGIELLTDRTIVAASVVTPQAESAEEAAGESGEADNGTES